MENSIYIAGHNGMVGSAIHRLLSKDKNIKIITVSRQELDLTNQKAVGKFLEKNKPTQIILAAAKVGGINANNIYPAQFISENLQIQTNIIDQAHFWGINKLLFLGSSCIYPKHCPQPIKEDYLLDGKLEPTNEPYAIAKIAGLKMCDSYNRQYGRDYRAVMPTNLYGPGDNFHLENSHVVPALLRRFHEAKLSNKKEVVIWGTGNPRREFLHVDDMASACLFVLGLERQKYETVISKHATHINVGTGYDITIKKLAEQVSLVVGYKGNIIFDEGKPDGTPRKLLDVTKLEDLGWNSSIDLEDGLKNTYEWYSKNKNHL